MVLKGVDRILNFISDSGKLKQWPGKPLLKRMALVYIWNKLDKDKVYTEKEISNKIDSLIEFDDFVLIRRELVGRGFVSRKRDCTEYRINNYEPDEKEKALLIN